MHFHGFHIFFLKDLFLAFLPSLIVTSAETDRKVGEREGERHAAKVVVNGSRTPNSLSGRSLYMHTLGPLGHRGAQVDSHLKAMQLRVLVHAFLNF